MKILKSDNSYPKIRKLVETILSLGVILSELSANELNNLLVISLQVLFTKFTASILNIIYK